MTNNKLTFDGNAYRIELSSGIVYEGSTTNLIAQFAVNTITICDRATKLHIPIMSSRANILEINGEVKTFEQAQTTIEDALSSAGGSGSSTWGSITGTLANQTDLKNSLDAKQDKLTAGSGIFIAADGKTISATGGGGGGDAVWGTIMGTLSDQSDLKNAIDAKADSSEVPTKVSQLTNDAAYITLDDVPTNPTKVSELTNDSGFQSAAEVSSAITSAINALDKSDSAVDGQYVSSVSEKNGVITVTREDLPQGSGAEWGSITGDINQQTDLALAFNNVELSLNSKQDKLSSGAGVGIDSHNNLYAKTTIKGIGVNASNEIQLLLGSGLSIGTSGADLNKLICTVQPSGGSSKSVNVLFVGNSFSKNSVAYLPYILNNIAPELKYRIAIASISGAPLAQHYASLFNQSVSVGGTTYTPTSYNYWEVDNTETRWTGGEPTDAHQTWQDAAVTKSISDILADGHWDIICFQQGGQTAASDWNTYYAPFIYGIHSKVSEIATTNGYTTKFAWNLTHGAYQATHANQKTAWQGTGTNSKYVMERTGTSLLFPYGTAVQNLRTTSLDAAGVGGDGIGLLSGDTTHLHEGVAKYAAAMAIALPLLHDLGIIANPVSDDFRITKALTETYNVPYPNYGTSNTVKGIDDSKCFIAQMAAIASVNNPYSETDLSGYDGNVPETYTVKNYLNSGGSYIDLGVKVLDEKWDVESKFRLAGTSTQVWLYWYRGNSGQYEQISQILYTSGDGAPRWPICSRSSAVNGTRPQVTSMNASTDYTVSTSGNHAYLNGTQLSNTMDEIDMYRPDHNFELFSKIHTNADGTSTAREVSPNIRVYNFKLKHSGGTVALDLVPAVRDSDSAVGMIDQSTNIFYPCVGGTPSVG